MPSEVQSTCKRSHVVQVGFLYNDRGKRGREIKITITWHLVNI